MNTPLRTAFTVSHILYRHFHFLLSQVILIYSLMSLLHIHYLVACCLASMYFSVFFLYLISCFIPLWSQKMLHMISSSYTYWDLLCGFTCVLSWKMFMWTWKECLFWFFGWNVNLLSPIGLMCHLRPLFPCWLFGWSSHWSQ